MKKNILFSKLHILILTLFILSTGIVKTQIITCIPANPTPVDAVTITFDATKGNKALMGYLGDVYAHAGVITSESTSGSDWKYAPSWGDNSDKYKLTRVSTDKYELKITPSIEKYYNTKPSEIINKLAFVFRSSDTNKQGKTESGGDIFYDVTDTSLNIDITSPAQKPVVLENGDQLIIKASSKYSQTLSLFVNNTLIRSVSGKTIQDTFTVTNNEKTWIKIIANRNNETVADSFFYFVSTPVVSEDLPAGIDDGINYVNDSTVYLCLVAPNKKTSYLIGDFNNWELNNDYLMKQTPDKKRFWTKLDKLEKGQEYAYQYTVDGSVNIADPFAEKVLDPSNDQFIPDSIYPNLKAYPIRKTTGIVSVLQTAQTPYVWRHSISMPAKQNLVIYELLVRDFISSHSYKGVIDSLRYLKRLGINAIELMPVMEFEGNISWGYNPSFHFAPDKYYGTKNDLKHFIDTCHSQGIAVILDIVLNHAFGQNPMVQLYWDKVNNRPAADNPWFNPIPKHDYNVGYDFNHESVYTKKYVSQVLKHWLTNYNLDGFRFDLSKGFTQKNTLGDVAAWGHYDASRVAILKSIADTIWKTKSSALMILEHLGDNDEEQVLVDYGMMTWGNMNNNYLEAAMGYIQNSDFSWGSNKARNFSKPGLVSYMESHDEERLMYKVEKYGTTANPNYIIQKDTAVSLMRAELAAAFFFTIPGAKMIWQFGELGYDTSINYNGRTGPKPILWSYYNNPKRFRLYNIYSELIKLKLSNEAFNSDNYNLNITDSIKLISITDASMDVRIVGNFGVNKSNAKPVFSKTGKWYDYFSGDSITVTDINQNIPLEISEYKIFTTKKLNKPNVIAAPEARNVKVNGTLNINSTLTGSYDYYDANGDIEGTSIYKWYKSTKANGSDKILITGTTGKQYIITNEDKYYYIFFEVIPIAKTGTIVQGIPKYASVGIATEIKDKLTDNISVFPNPFYDFLTVKKNGTGFDKFSLTAIDLTGRVVLNKTGVFNFPVNMAELNKGSYILLIKTNNKVVQKNVIKIN